MVGNCLRLHATAFRVVRSYKYYANADVKMKQDAVEKATSDFNLIIRSAVDFTFNNEDVVLKRLY
ncbi:hypothetical protein [Succinivibrio dextrinosolvens]|uniref:hypothetical protein n=1 Tax=Succinivibrio dextrinosolvens TaxID=83771 RepID=UPI000945041B|nr:hypothetical protein [Succinivibrio dextrinosolvens]